MHSDDEREDDDDDVKQKDMEFKVERFLDHSQFYLNQLLLLKNELNDIDRLNQADLYIQKLNEIDKIIHDLAKSIHNIEQLPLRLNEKERLKLDHQIDLLRIEIDREMSQLHILRGETPTSPFPLENILLTDEIDNQNIEPDSSSNELRQRHITTNRINDSYDLLEQDLAHLRESIDEVAALVAQQQQALSNREYYLHMAQYRIRNASSFLQRAVYNRYVTLASGALLGASIGGPVGFVMGTKIGALVALSGSAVGALSMNIMRQRATQPDESQNDTIAYNQAML